MSDILRITACACLALAPIHALAQSSDACASTECTVAALVERVRALEAELARREPVSVATARGGASVEGVAAPGINDENEAVDQRLRTLARNLELEREQQTETAKRAPVIRAGGDGFQLRSGDGDFQLRLRGLLQSDGRFVAHDRRDSGADTFVMRRVRPILEGTLFKFVDFRLTPDFGGGTTVIQDAYIDLVFSPSAKVRAGKQKQPLGLERLVSASAIPFIERALPTAVAPNRDLGVTLYGEALKNRFSYWAGVFNGVTDGGSADIDDGDGKDLVGRVFMHPFRGTSHQRLSGFGAGLSASYGSQRGGLLSPGLPTYRSSGQQVVFRYRGDATPAGTVLADGTRYRLSAQGYLYAGRLGMLAEQVFSSQEVRRGTTTGSMGVNAWQVMTSWVLTGESASYAGVTPRYAFEPSSGHLGAFELTGRYHELTADPDAFPIFANPLIAVRAARAWAGGLNWYLNRSVKLSADYEQTRYTGGASDGNRPTEHDVLARVQLGF
jgi:phosphate-selective porin OprO/OprP